MRTRAGDRAPGPVPRASRRLRLIAVEWLDVLEAGGRLESRRHVVADRAFGAAPERARPLRFQVAHSREVPSLKLRRAAPVTDVLVVAVHEGKGRAEGPSSRGLVHDVGRCDPAHGADLVLGAWDLAHGRVVGSHARLILVDVLLGKIEAEHRLLPEHSHVDGTMLGAAARERAHGDEGERNENRECTAKHGTPPRGSGWNRGLGTNGPGPMASGWETGRARSEEEDRRVRDPGDEALQAGTQKPGMGPNCGSMRR